MDKNFEPTMGQPVDQYFTELQNSLQKEEPKGRELTVEENRQMQDGFAVEEMMHSAGWSIVYDFLSAMPKQHVDPRGMNAEEWKFAELNAFWHGEVAKELLESLATVVSQAHELQRIKLGEATDVKKMRF